MTDLPILFSAPMVRASIEGRKAMTRRSIKLPTKDIYEHPEMGGWEATTSGGDGCFTIAKDGTRIPEPEKVAIWHRTTGYCAIVRYQTGDRLWVRETVRAEENADGIDGVRYLADDEWIEIENSQKAADAWVDLYAYRGKRGLSVPSIHMPRWTSRLTLIVTGVKVERLRKVTNEDAIAEGVGPLCHPLGREDLIWVGTEMACKSPYLAFRDLWTEINGADSWAANPWVAVISFKTHKCNIDRMPA